MWPDSITETPSFLVPAISRERFLSRWSRPCRRSCETLPEYLRSRLLVARGRGRLDERGQKLKVLLQHVEASVDRIVSAQSSPASPMAPRQTLQKDPRPLSARLARRPAESRLRPPSLARRQGAQTRAHSEAPHGRAVDRSGLDGLHADVERRGTAADVAPARAPSPGSVPGEVGSARTPADSLGGLGP
jgi:hypothetical protein